MKKERTNLALRLIKRNDGQIEWLPKNPRQWTQTDIDRTARSIEEDPDFLEDRPLLVTPNGNEYVVFAGNLRREGAKIMKIQTIPTVIYYPDTEDDRLTVKRRALKDNGSFGSWDFDELANSWDDLPLVDFGIPAWDHEENGGSAGEGGVGGSAQEDDFDEDDKGILVRCKTGDIWELGDHRLMCGDSTDLETVKKLMGGVK